MKIILIIKRLFRYIYSNDYHKSYVVHYKCVNCKDSLLNEYYYIVIPGYRLGFKYNLKLMDNFDMDYELLKFKTLDEARKYICDNLLNRNIYIINK